MTKRTLIDSYTRGELDRRGFIQGLTALGVGAAAAATYAVQFGPSAAASSNSGFVMNARQQDTTDEEYGTAITLESDEQGVEIALAQLGVVADLLAAGLAAFTASDFTDAGLPSSTADLLGTIQEQLADQMDALSALGLDLGTAAGGAGTPPSTPASPQELLSQLSDQLDTLTSALAAIAPALEDGEARQLVTNIGFSVSDQSAIVAYLAGENPIPAAFEEPALP